MIASVKIRPTVSLCMIMRNEERWLAQCLRSVEGLADEIVIVDTGSEDRSIEIARSFGAKVFEHPWEDDFSKSRNRSLDYATGDWILVMDADEVIAASEKEKILALVQNPPASLIYFVQTNYMEKPENNGWEPNFLEVPEARGYPGFVESKLARLCLRGTARFHGVIHEHLEPVDPAMPRFYANLRIHHYGKYSEAAVAERKGKLYTNLGLKKLREEPDNVQAYYEMGAQYLENQEYDEAYRILVEGEKKDPYNSHIQILLVNLDMRRKNIGSAIQRFLKILEVEPQNINPYIYLPSLLIENKQYDLAEHILKAGEPFAKEYPTYHLNCGALKMKQGNIRKALHSYLKAIDIHPHYYLAHLNAGYCYGEIGDWENAERHYRIAYNSPDTRSTALQGLGKVSFHQKKYAEAASWIEKAIQEATPESHEKNLLYLSKATILASQKDYKAAKETLQKISNFNDFSDEHLTSLNECLKKIATNPRQGVSDGNQHQYN